MDQTVEVRIRTADLSDRRHPEQSGRYVNLTDLMVALEEASRAEDPFAAICKLIYEVAQK